MHFGSKPNCPATRRSGDAFGQRVQEKALKRIGRHDGAHLRPRGRQHVHDLLSQIFGLQPALARLRRERAQPDERSRERRLSNQRCQVGKLARYLGRDSCSATRKLAHGSFGVSACPLSSSEIWSEPRQSANPGHPSKSPTHQRLRSRDSPLDDDPSRV